MGIRGKFSGSHIVSRWSHPHHFPALEYFKRSCPLILRYSGLLFSCAFIADIRLQWRNTGWVCLWYDTCSDRSISASIQPGDTTPSNLAASSTAALQFASIQEYCRYTYLTTLPHILTAHKTTVYLSTRPKPFAISPTSLYRIRISQR